MQEHDPVISVLMSVYNSEKYLSEAIESILHQTFADFEFIIIDDASTDRSLEIIQEHAAVDDRIIVVENDDNLGLTRNLNKGIHLARGEYIARMDADDISLPERFEKQFAYMCENQDVWVLGGQTQRIDAFGEPTARSWIYEQKYYLWTALIKIPGVAHPTALMRKDKIMAIGGYPEEFKCSQDQALWSKLFDYGFPIRNIPDIVLKYRTHDENISNVFRTKQEKSSKEIRRRLIVKELGYEISTAEFENLFCKPVNDLNFEELATSIRILEDLYSRFISRHLLSWQEKIYARKNVASRLLEFASVNPFQSKEVILKALMLYPLIPLTYLKKFL